MSLTLLMHPLASYCHKVLIALYENGTPFTPRTINLGDPAERAELAARWPMVKFPVLLDGERTIAESTTIIEYLCMRHPGKTALLPDDAEQRFDVRFWDRFFDIYVHEPMQKIVGDHLRPENARDATGVAGARATLATAYGVLDKQLAGGQWAAGPRFTLADCAAAPSLFYATIVAPHDAGQRNLAAYFDRLMAHPPVKRTLDEAKPYFQYFPFKEKIPARFL